MLLFSVSNKGDDVLAKSLDLALCQLAAACHDINAPPEPYRTGNA